MTKKKNVPLLRTALRHKCPACGKGNIYEKILDIKTRCDKCGHRLKDHDAGDGPVFFAMLFTGIIVTALAFIIEIYFMIPLILHIIIWFPATIGLCILFLKITKSWLIAMQYRHNVGGFRKKKK